jgi:hypothetical protein
VVLSANKVCWQQVQRQQAYLIQSRLRSALVYKFIGSHILTVLAPDLLGMHAVLADALTP